MVIQSLFLLQLVHVQLHAQYFCRDNRPLHDNCRMYSLACCFYCCRDIHREKGSGLTPQEVNGFVDRYSALLPKIRQLTGMLYMRMNLHPYLHKDISILYSFIICISIHAYSRCRFVLAPAISTSVTAVVFASS